MEFSGQGGGELNRPARARLLKSDFRGVKKIPAERRQRTPADMQLAGGAIKRIAHDRMAQRGKMDADLVRAAGVDLHFEERGRSDASQHSPVGARFPGIGQRGGPAGGHAGAAIRVAGDGKFDAAAIFCQQSLHQRDVGFLNAAFAKGFG